MIVGSLWDQEDSYGAVATYAALEGKDRGNDKLFLVLGPWRHSGANYDAATLGPLRFDADTALAFRRDILKPFLDARLKDHPPKAATAPVTIYETGSNAWRRLQRWPLACAKGCAAGMRSLYLLPGGRAGFEAPREEGFDEYVSDPAKPGPLRTAAGALRRFRRVEALAGERSARGRRPARRLELGQRAAREAAQDRRRAAG
jgi:predicted acyl esterase